MERQPSEAVAPIEGVPREAVGGACDEVSPASCRERKLVVALVGAILVLTGFFASPVLLRRIPVRDDLGLFNLPVRDFYARCLQQGESFDWMPQAFGGYFLTGEGQHGPYHPAHWLLYRWLPLDTAFALEVFLPVVVLATGMVCFLRRYVDFAGACLGAMIATFSWMFISHLQNPQMASVLAHTPWLLALIDTVVYASTAAKKRWACVGIALLTGSQVLLGHPQALWLSMLTCSLYAGYVLLVHRASWGAWVAVVGGLSLGLCIGAVQLLPTYSLLTNSTRIKADDAFKAFGSNPIESLCAFLAPYVAWDRVPKLGGVYLGAVPLVLAAWWITAHRMRSKSPQEAESGSSVAHAGTGSSTKAIRLLTLWCFLFVVLTSILALGIHGKLYYLLMRLPVVGNFRGPCRFLILTQISLGILTALAFARLVSFVRRGEKTPYVHLVLPWLAVAVSIVLAVWFAAYADSDMRNHTLQAQFFIGPLFVGAAAVALTLAARGRHSGLLLLVLLAAVDIGLFSVAHPRAGKIQWRKLPTYQEFLARYPCPPGPPDEGRVFDDRWSGSWDILVNYLWLHGYRTINGYAALFPAKLLDYRDIHTLRAAQVAWFWQPANAKSVVDGLGPPQNGGWRRVPDPLPRVRLVSKVKISDQPCEDLKKINVDTTALVSRRIELPPSAPGTAKLLEERPGEISIEVDAPARQVLVLSESYDGDWQVSVDGTPTPLEQVNGDFLGCAVDGGKHRVEFAFHSASLRVGQFVSLASLAVALVVGFGPSLATIRSSPTVSEGACDLVPSPAGTGLG